MSASDITDLIERHSGAIRFRYGDGTHINRLYTDNMDAGMFAWAEEQAERRHQELMAALKARASEME
ncbi:MAG: hypothetical protein ACR2QF_09330 [Geminicoccaceae bacterium]